MPATPNKQDAVGFVTNFLSRPASSIPKGSQWAVVFENIGSLKGAIKKSYEYENSYNSKWSTLETAEAILTEQYQSDHGCMFCQAIGLPGDGTDVVVEGNVKSGGFIRSYVGAGRNDYPIMRMTFLDTNVSFVDSFLRGWSLATANFGLIMTKGDENRYRINLSCYKFAITPTGPYILQTMTFKDVCCVGVSEEEYRYDNATAPVLREARFIYNSYSVDTVANNQPIITKNSFPPTNIVSGREYGERGYGPG